MAEESLMEREDFQITKKKIIKTNDLLHMYQVKTEKVNKASQAFKQLKTKHQGACQEAERLKLDNEQLNDSMNKYKTDLEQTSINFAQLQCEYRSLEEKYEQNMIDSQMTITELEEKVKQYLSNNNMAPSPGKRNAVDRLREMKQSYSELKVAEHQKTVENKALLKEINQLKDAAAKKAAKIRMKDNKEINDLKDQKANAAIQDQNRLNSIEKSHKEDSETEVATLKSEISYLEDKCRCLTELLNSAKNRDIDRCDIFTQTEYSLPEDAKTVSSPPQVRHCVIDSDEFESLMEAIRLPLLSPIRSDSSDSPNSLSKKKNRKFRGKRKKLQGKFDTEAPPAPPAPTVESVENSGENKQNNALENQDTTINFTNTLKRVPNTEQFALCVEEEKRLNSHVEHDPVAESICSKNDQFVHANVNNSSDVKGGVSDIWPIIDDFDKNNQYCMPQNQQMPIKDMTAPLETQKSIVSFNMETSSASGIENSASFPYKHPFNESLSIPLLKRDEKDSPECTPTESKKREDDYFRENSSNPLPEAKSPIQQSKQQTKSKTKMRVKANQRRKVLMPYNTTRLLRARVPKWRQCRESTDLHTGGDTILSALQLLKANNISFTISSDAIQPFPSLMITPPKAEISSDFQSNNKPFKCRTVCLDQKCTQNGMILREALQGEEPELLGFFHIKDTATSSLAAGRTISQLPDPVKQLAEELLNVLKDMNGSKKKQVRKCCKPRRSTSTGDNSKSEFERLCDAPGVLQRNKRLLAEARRQSNRLNDYTGRESDIDDFLDSGLVTATTKHDTDSQSLCSYNEDLTRNFRSSSIKSDVKAVRKNANFSYSKALAARSSINPPIYQKIDEDTLTVISKSNSCLLPELSLNTVDLECSHADFKSEVRNSFTGFSASLDELSEPDLFGGNTPKIVAKTNIESNVDTTEDGLVNALDWEVTPIELETGEVNNGFSGLDTSFDGPNEPDGLIEKDTVKMNKKHEKQNIVAKTRVESKVDNPEPQISILNRTDSSVDLKTAEINSSFNSLDSSLDEVNEADRLIGQNEGQKQKLIGKSNAESKVDSPEPSSNTLHLKGLPVESKTAEVNNYLSGLDTSFDGPNEPDGFIEKDTVKMNKKHEKQNIVAKTRVESKVDSPEPQISILNRTDSSVDLKTAEINSSFNSLDSSLDEVNEADRLIGQNEGQKQKLIGKSNAESKVDSPEPSSNTLHLKGLPVESKTAEVNNYLSGLDTSFDGPNEPDGFIEKDTVRMNKKREKQNIIAKTRVESKLDSPEPPINILNRTDSSVNLKTAEINSSFNSLDTSLDEPNEADSLIGQNNRKKRKLNVKINVESKVDSPKPPINTLEGSPVESKTAEVKNGFSDLDTSLDKPNATESLTDKKHENKKINASMESKLGGPRTRRSPVKKPALVRSPSTRVIQLRNKSIQVEPKIEKPKKTNQQQPRRNSPICSNESDVDCSQIQQVTCSGKVANTETEKLNQSSSTIKKKSRNVRNTRATSKRITRPSRKLISKESVSGSSSDCSVKDETVDSRAYLPGNRLNTGLDQDKEMTKSAIDSSSKPKRKISAAVNMKYDTKQLFGSETDSSDQDLAACKPESLLKEDATEFKEIPFTENTEIDRVEITDESKKEVSCQINIPDADNPILNKFNRIVDENLKTKTWSDNAQIQRDEIADQDELQRALKRNFDEFKTRYNDKYLKPKPLKNDVHISLDEKREPGFVWNIVNNQSKHNESGPAVSESRWYIDESTSSCTQEELGENCENTKGNNKINIIHDIVVSRGATPLRETSYCGENCDRSDVTVQQHDMFPGGLADVTKSALPLASTSYGGKNWNPSTSDLIDDNGMMSDDCLADVNLETEDIDLISFENGDLFPNLIESLDSHQSPPPIKKKVMNRGEILDTMNRLIMFSEDVEVVNEAAQKFSDQAVDFIAFVFLEKLCHDIFDKPNNDCPPSPVMTATQRILLGFLTRLDNTTHKGILNKFLDVAAVQLFKKPHDANIVEPVTRVYTAICRMQLNINRMRRFICESFYFAEEYANSILFIVLTMWGNVMPMAADLAKYPLAKIIIQLCYTTKKSVPQILPLRDLLQKYFGYPADPWNSDELFEELLERYIKNPFERQSDFAILLFLRNHPAKWVFQKVKNHLMLLFRRIPNSNSNLRANLIIFMGNICNVFQAHIDEQWIFIREMTQWFETIQNVEGDPVVQKSLILAKNRLPVRRVRAKKGIKSVKDGETSK